MRNLCNFSKVISEHCLLNSEKKHLEIRPLIILIITLI